jgi:hypothetical protein
MGKGSGVGAGDDRGRDRGGWVALALLHALLGSVSYLIVGAVVIGGGIWLYGKGQAVAGTRHPDPAPPRGRREDVQHAQPLIRYAAISPGPKARAVRAERGPVAQLRLRHLLALTNGKLRRV